MEALAAAFEGLKRCWKRLGPVLLVEILLPGGTLVALLLLFYQRRREHTRPPAETDRLMQRSNVTEPLPFAYPMLIVRR